MIMDLNDNIRILWQVIASSIREITRQLPGRPTSHARLGKEAETHRNRITRTSISARGLALLFLLGLLELPALTLRVDGQQGMVHDLGIAGTHFDRRDILPFGQIGRQDEAAE